MTTREKYIWLGILVLAGLAVYSSGLGGKYFSDDFKSVFESPFSRAGYLFTHANPHSSFYRPAESMVLAEIQSLFGLNTLPIHLLVLSCHVFLSWLVMNVMVSLGFSRVSAVVGAGFMLVSQANALAVLSNDTLSQVMGTLLGCVSLWLLWKSEVAVQKNDSPWVAKPRGLYVMSILAFTCSLLMKETSIGFLVAIPLLSILSGSDENWSSKRRGLINSIPFVLVGFCYLVLRASIMQAQPDPRYSIHFGVNIIENAGLLVFSAVVPFSSVSLFAALPGHEYLFLVFVGVVSATFISLVLRGLMLEKRSREVSLITILALATLLPAIMIAHTSELYVYSAMPLFSMLVGIGATATIEGMKGAFKQIIILFGGWVLMSHILAVQSKAALLVHNGEAAEELIEKILPYVAQVPQNGTLVLVIPRSEKPEYSVYLMSGFRVLAYGENILNRQSGRKDFRTWNIKEEDARRLLLPSAALLLTLEGDSVKLLKK